MPTPSACYCRRCGYDLHGQLASAPRCPECGRPFDPANPRTFRRRPLPPNRRWLSHFRRAAAAAFALVLLLAAIWLWLFWGWYDEQRTVSELNTRRVGRECLSPWLRDHLDSSGFVLDRVSWIDLSERTDIKDASSLRRLTRLRQLDLAGTSVTDLTPLAGLTDLEHLDVSVTKVQELKPLAALTKLVSLNLSGSEVRDLSPLAGLTELHALYLDTTPVTDFSPLTRLVSLRRLTLSDTAVRDLTPVLGLSHLLYLRLDHTAVTDLSPLARIHSLQELHIPLETIPETQIETLQPALPRCEIYRRPASHAAPPVLWSPRPAPTTAP